MNTSYNNMISGERTVGGARSIFSDTGIVTLPSGFKATLTDIPDITEGYIPAGTPIQVDEASRAVKFFKTAKVSTATTPTTGDLTLDIEKELDANYGRNPFKVGDIIMVLGADMSTAGLAVKITAIDRSATTKDVLTLNDEIVADKGDYIVLANEESASAAVPAVVPNALTPYDVVKDPYGLAVYVEAAFALYNGVVYERRIPMIPSQVKESLRANGCNFKFSQSK